MERRKFVVGMGALASGTAAAVGSGAFTSVQADRGVAVTVAGDADAYLALTPSDDPNGQFVDDSGDLITLDFGDSGNDGTGINDQAYTIFESVLEVRNQGTENIKVGVTGISVSEGDFQAFVSRTDLEYGSGSVSEGAQGLRLDGSANEVDLPVISPGEGITIGFAFNDNKSSNFADINEDLTILAGTKNDFPSP